MTKFKQAVIKALDNYDPFYFLQIEKERINEDARSIAETLPPDVRTQEALSKYISDELERG